MVIGWALLAKVDTMAPDENKARCIWYPSYWPDTLLFVLPQTTTEAPKLMPFPAMTPDCCLPVCASMHLCPHVPPHSCAPQVIGLCQGRPGGCGIPATYLSSQQSKGEALAVLRELNKDVPTCKLL